LTGSCPQPPGSGGSLHSCSKRQTCLDDALFLPDAAHRGQQVSPMRTFCTAAYGDRHVPSARVSARCCSKRPSGLADALVSCTAAHRDKHVPSARFSAQLLTGTNMSLALVLSWEAARRVKHGSAMRSKGCPRLLEETNMFRRYTLGLWPDTNSQGPHSLPVDSSGSPSRWKPEL